MEVPVSYNKNIFEDRDFLFKSDCAQNFGLIEGVFAYIADFIIFII